MAPRAEEIASIAGRARGSLAERYGDSVFSRELWGEMGEMGLLGITVPEELGGSGGTALDLAEAVRLFAHDSCDMGMTLSWITHLALCAKSIELFGTEAQKQEYLPRLASGEWVGAAAVSEPKTGAHPAGIETTATRTDRGYRMYGKKLYVTDGPVADLLVVVASTGEQEGGMKELTAFLVPTDADGFEASVMELNFLKTSPHGELTFNGVEVPTDAVLGAPGEGHSQASRSSFARERSLVLSAFVGMFTAAAEECAAALAGAGGLAVEGKESAAWIHHMSALHAYSHLSSELVDVAFTDAAAWRKQMDVLIYMGISYAKWAAWIAEFAARRKVADAFPLDVLLADMRLVLVGEKMLFTEGRRRYIKPCE